MDRINACAVRRDTPFTVHGFVQNKSWPEFPECSYSAASPDEAFIIARNLLRVDTGIQRIVIERNGSADVVPLPQLRTK